jgi:hypothetical protein
MTMSLARNPKRWKRAVRLALALVLLVDAGLAIYVWRAGTLPRAQAEERAQLRLLHEQLGGDVRRAHAIRQNLPRVREDCDRFFEEQFLDAGGGYSSVVADLNAIARRAGVASPGLRFSQREIEARGVIEVSVDTVAEGDYRSLVRFINGLERSEHFYLLESLALGSTGGGRIKLNLGLKTFFRPQA